MLQKVVAAGLEVCSVGKIDDIFAHQGITRSNHTTNNAAGLVATLEFLEDDFKGLLFVNLIEFDMIYGHRNDAVRICCGAEESGRCRAGDPAAPAGRLISSCSSPIMGSTPPPQAPTTAANSLLCWSSDRRCGRASILVIGGLLVMWPRPSPKPFELEPPLVGQSFLEEITT